MLTLGNTESLCQVGLKKLNCTALMAESKLGHKSVPKNVACKWTE